MFTHKVFLVGGILLVSYFTGLLAGCASFPPAHENSFYVKDEKVSIRMLQCGELREYAADWNKAFESVQVPYACPACGVEARSLPGAAVGILAPLAFDYIKRELDKEAENYVQQFGATYFGRDFWTGQSGDCDQKYYGMELVRFAAGHNGVAIRNEPGTPVFKMIYGIARDREGFFWAAPLFFKTDQAKARVASWGSSHEIDTKVEIGIDSVWTDDKGKYHSGNVASFDALMITGYNIDKPRELRPSCTNGGSGSCGHLEGGLNSFAGVPASGHAGQGQTGNFWLKVLVTESDRAKTKKYITALAGLLDKNKARAVDYIKKQAEP